MSKDIKSNHWIFLFFLSFHLILVLVFFFFFLGTNDFDNLNWCNHHTKKKIPEKEKGSSFLSTSLENITLSKAKEKTIKKWVETRSALPASILVRIQYLFFLFESTIFFSILNNSLLQNLNMAEEESSVDQDFQPPLLSSQKPTSVRYFVFYFRFF